MKYVLKSEFMVSPTFGLDGEVGKVRIIGVMDHEAAGEANTAPYTDGLSGSGELADTHYAELVAATWYAFRYIDEEQHESWGVMHLPEELLESMVEAAVQRLSLPPVSAKK